ncbi:IS3 family transposase [Arthrobacter sp. GMC3]|uniref:IS3 family transposase n=1 Tax=Arthrobacter sp. GMC3 TaxID=2058894 RepID=UPI0034CEBB6A
MGLHGEIKEGIRGAFSDARGVYGHQGILAILRRQGRSASKKTVRTLMRALGLEWLVPQRGRHNSFRVEVGQGAHNVWNRQHPRRFHRPHAE